MWARTKWCPHFHIPKSNSEDNQIILQKNCCTIIGRGDTGGVGGFLVERQYRKIMESNQYDFFTKIVIISLKEWLIHTPEGEGNSCLTINRKFVMLSITIIITIITRSNELVPNSENITIQDAVEAFLESITLSRSENTARTYQNAMNAFMFSLKDANLDLDSKIGTLTEDSITWFATYLKDFSPTTERLYLTAANRFYEFLAAERLLEPNLPRVRMLIRQRARRFGQRLPQFPRNHIESIIDYSINLTSRTTKDEADALRNRRDRAFLITLADTGMRVHEACNLRRGDIDWNEGKAVIIGKGDQQDVVRFSRRSLKFLRDYLSARASLDGASGKPMTSLPLFARHDKGAGKKIKPITTTTGRNIVAQRVEEALGSDAVGTVTPHSFRHYFVTTVLHGSGGNLKLAQELARHKNISVTQRYAHLSDDELDRGYWDIFEDSP
jgi:site-specific recombinase XerD